MALIKIYVTVKLDFSQTINKSCELNSLYTIDWDLVIGSIKHVYVVSNYTMLKL